MQDVRKVRLQSLTLALMQKKSYERMDTLLEKADMLELAKIYMGDKITDLDDRFKATNSELEDVKAKLLEMRDRNMSKELRFVKVRDAIQELKTEISWGKFNGSVDELNEIFKKVLDLL